MANAHHLGIQFRQAAERYLVLLFIKHKSFPPQHKGRPRANRIARDEGAPFGPVKGQVARRMPRREQDLYGANPVALMDEMVNLDRNVLGNVEVQSDLQGYTR
jgi:hypothetical protein